MSGNYTANSEAATLGGMSPGETVYVFGPQAFVYRGPEDQSQLCIDSGYRLPEEPVGPDSSPSWVPVRLIESGHGLRGYLADLRRFNSLGIPTQVEWMRRRLADVPIGGRRHAVARAEAEEALASWTPVLAAAYFNPSDRGHDSHYDRLYQLIGSPCVLGALEALMDEGDRHRYVARPAA